MVAHLYIIAESFQNNACFTNEEIEEKIKRLAEDVGLINKYKESNQLYANYDVVYPVKFYSTFTVFDFICNPVEVKKFVDRDVVNSFQTIFDRAENTAISTREVKEDLLGWNDADNCHGIIAFYKIEEIDDSFQVIYGIDGWYKFRRHFLGVYPQTGEFFIDECKKYYPKLFFHEQNKVSVVDIMDNFSGSIVKHLGYLNDVFYTYRTRSFDNESVKYHTLTSECKLEADAASKDKNSSKEKLTFDFINISGLIEKISCYPHLRLCQSDNKGDSYYYQHRIYFHEGIDTIWGGNILIGHIGEHL